MCFCWFWFTGWNCDKRPSGHAQAGGDFPEHRSGIPVRTGAATATGSLFARRLYLQKRYRNYFPFFFLFIRFQIHVALLQQSNLWDVLRIFPGRKSITKSLVLSGFPCASNREMPIRFAVECIIKRNSCEHNSF